VSAPDADATGDGVSSRKRWLQRLRLPLGLALLVVIFRFLPLDERLIWTPESGEAVEVPGEVLGDWRADTVEFLPDASWAREGTIPPLLEGWKEGSPITVTRGPSTDGPKGAYGWHPAVLRVFRDIDGSWLAAALALFFLGNCLVVTRWWRLLRAIGVGTRWTNVFRLNFLGLFFNAVVPGLTGGDVVKAVIVVRESPGRRTDAFVSVLVDRLIGLVALAGLAAVLIFVVPGFEELRRPVLLFLGAAIAGALVYTSTPVRRLVRFDALLAKLPLGDKLKVLDDAVLLYRAHAGEVGVALLISLTNHFAYITGVSFLGLACGVLAAEVSWSEYLVIVPIANIVTALPLTPGGLGIGEALYVWLFAMVGARGSLGVAVSLTFRLSQMLLGLLGGIFLLLPGARAEVGRARESGEQAD
jgi:hypothetical protein